MHVLWIIPMAIAVLMLIMAIIAAAKKSSSVYKNKPEERNPMEGKRVKFVEDENEKENADGVRGHLEAIGETEHQAGAYEKVFKRILDIMLSFGGLVILSPVFLFLSLWIVIDDPGPVLFTQKRIGKDKQYFKLHKFRSMKMSTPHDKPTHMLENPEQYITKAGDGGIIGTTYTNLVKSMFLRLRILICTPPAIRFIDYMHLDRIVQGVFFMSAG